MDFTSKIRYAIEHTLCEKHGAIRHGQPCWWIPTDGLALRAAICGNRAAKMYTGKVSDSSFDRRSSAQPNKNASRYPKKEHTR